jgi:hypothetical protein
MDSCSFLSVDNLLRSLLDQRCFFDMLKAIDEFPTSSFNKNEIYWV